MIKMKLTGPWMQTRSLLKNYGQRLQFVYSKTAEDLAKAFLGKLKEMAPRGEEYEQYVDSLQVVRLVGRQDLFAFAVVSKRMKVKVGKLLVDDKVRNQTVVYIQPGSSIEDGSVVGMLSEANPWPVDMIPSGIPRKGVILIHRLVTDDEMKWAINRTAEFIREKRGELSRFGLVFGKVEDPEKDVEEMSSLPDYMALGLRAEFGINAEQRSHWRPALHWVRKNVAEIVNGDDDIRAALHDWLFKKHTLSKWSQEPEMKDLKFKKECGDFQRKVVSG